MKNPRQSRAISIRKVRNGAVVAFALVATAAALGWLGAVLWALLANGTAGLGPSLFLEGTPPPGSSGGLANAIFGSLVLTGLGIAIAIPIGLLAGTYIVEIGPHSRLAHFTRFTNELLLSAPSIIVGLFIYVTVVMPMGHFSAWAGALALALIAVPIIVHTTQGMLALVPDYLREASAALGAPRWKTVTAVTWRAAAQGLLTGVLLAVARISGETAPLLFTALNNQFWNTNLDRPMANLPVVIFQFAMSPYEEWRQLAWNGALLITLAVLALNITARWISRQRRASR